ncbi:MAG: sulfatase-like hydrolase/transferase [Cyclobacteriaceae bacterium]|nr:sulfatase-like hydrolase/transferase [Cyclobacteriaceae bacterium]
MKISAFKKFTQVQQTLLIRFGIIMLVYTLMRIVFFAANYNMFQETTLTGFFVMLLGGLKFDLSALLLINALYIISQTAPFRFRYKPVYQKITNIFFVITNALFIAINSVDIIYYRFILKRTTFSVIKNFEHETNLSALFFRFIFIDYWYITLLFIGLVYLMVWLFNKTIVSNPDSQKAWIYYPTQLATMLILLYFSVIGIRGGFTGTTRPITLNNAGRYVERPKEMAIVLNTPFSIFRTLNKQTFNRIAFFKEGELKTIYSPIHTPAPSKPFRNKNVVVFILESFGKEYFGAYNKDLDNGNYKGYTPFLDSLINYSLSFKYSYANGWKSIDGIPSVISSLPSLKGSFVLSNYSTNNTSSLALELKSKGYHTAFFHGAPNGSMGFLAYATVNGFDEYYGKTEYNNDDDYDGIWGIWDEEFFQFTANTLSTFKKPFLSTIFSVSSHHPYKVPKKHEGRFAKGNLKMHQVIGYTDFALRKFFEKASETDWYKNTLFIFTADHQSKSQFKQYNTSLGNHAVPIIFFDPSGELTGTSSKVAQQIDIVPTVLSYLNYDKPYFAFGNNLLSDSTNHFAIAYNGTYYTMAMGDYFLQFDDLNPIGFYNFKEDMLLTKNLVNENMPEMDSITKITKAFIQQYNNRMIDNKMSLESN